MKVVTRNYLIEQFKNFTTYISQKVVKDQTQAQEDIADLLEEIRLMKISINEAKAAAAAAQTTANKGVTDAAAAKTYADTLNTSTKAIANEAKTLATSANTTAEEANTAADSALTIASQAHNEVISRAEVVISSTQPTNTNAVWVDTSGTN